MSGRFLILLLSIFVLTDSLLASSRCQSAFARLQAQKSSKPRVAVLTTALIASLGLLSKMLLNSSSPSSANSLNNSTQLARTTDPWAMGSNGSLETRNSQAKDKTRVTQISMIRSAQDIPTERSDGFERAMEKAREEAMEKAEALGVDGELLWSPPDWDEIYSNPALSDDPNLEAQLKFNVLNAAYLGMEFDKWTYHQSLEEKARSLPDVLQVLDILQSTSEISKPIDIGYGHKYDAHADMTKFVSEAVAKFAAVLPDPDELGPKARANFDHYDELIRQFEMLPAENTKDLLSELWAQQLQMSGTISLPRAFERNRTTKTYTDGSSRTFRTIRYQDSRYDWTGEIHDDVSMPDMYGTRNFQYPLVKFDD